MASKVGSAFTLLSATRKLRIKFIYQVCAEQEKGVIIAKIHPDDHSVVEESLEDFITPLSKGVVVLSMLGFAQRLFSFVIYVHVCGLIETLKATSKHQDL